MALRKWLVPVLAVVGLRADTITLAAGQNYLTIGDDDALTVTTKAANAQTFERLYAGNGYFYLRVNGIGYVRTDAATGALTVLANDTSVAEQFQTSPAGSNVNLVARSTSGYVEVSGSTVIANASAGNATAFTLASTPDATPQVEVDFANPRQKIAGFGAADAFYTNWLTAHPNKEQIYALLFGRETLGASILRVQNIYGQNQNSPFDPDTAEVVAKANQYRGSPMTVLMTSWSPPGSLKASGQVSCDNTQPEAGCTLAKVNGGGYDYAGFAQYWFDSLNAYASLGVTPDYISLQNEPDFTPYPPGYAACRFDPTEEAGGIYAGYKQALDAVYTTLQTMPNPPAMVGPEVVGIGYNDPENYLSALDTDELGELGAVAHHLYHGGDSGAPDSFNAAMLQLSGAAPGKTLWETEFDHSSDQSTAMDTAWLIHDAMATEEASAYLYWSYFWPDTNQLVYIDNPFNSPSSWQYPNGYHINDYYYALQHFSRFVQPGFQRIASMTGLDELRATAYYSAPEHQLVFVLINTSNTDTLSPALVLPPYGPRGSQGGATLDSSPRTVERPAQPQFITTAVYRSTFSGTSERFALLGPLPANGVVTLPPQAVATVVVTDVRPPCGASRPCRTTASLLR
jgi:glucuronoarabinoxylan endo-1,4-beta-xylanase